MALAPGEAAPDFTLFATPDQKISLSELDQPVVLIFYPADWSPVCGDELTMFEAANRMFRERGAQLLGISVDGVWSHQAFRTEHKIDFPLLSDFHPKGEVARSYGVYRDEDGVCERALFVIDREQKVAWSYVSPIGVNPGADGALRAVEALS
ncbi:MAG: redoxin domain-containing protein [Acidimicrobiales bacterium]